jgi:hypothetical protein
MHYRRATLSACRVESHVNYMMIKEVLGKQYDAIIEKITKVIGPPVLVQAGDPLPFSEPIVSKEAVRAKEVLE